MKKAFALLGLLAVLVLTGCGWQGTGVIVQKTYSAPYDSIYFQCMAFDGKGMCTMNMPMTQHIEASYGYKVRDDKGDVHDVGVNHDYWNVHGVGETFDNREKKDS